METAMNDNVLQTLQRLVQDVIAPDVRELKVRLTSFERLVDERFASVSKEMDTRFGAMDARFVAMEERLDVHAKQTQTQFQAIIERLDARDKQHEAQFQAIMSAISESRAQADLAGMREIGQLRERVAVIESRLPSKAS